MLTCNSCNRVVQK